ncbi:MAG: hypothetical protein WBA39_13595 [Rivularia sp. (in: cyanobacteria)]
MSPFAFRDNLSIKNCWELILLDIIFRNSKELPKPVGKHFVGITQLDFTDENRKKVFPFEEDNAYRKIPVTVFYPAGSNNGQDSAPYSSSEILEVLSKTTFGIFSKSVAKIKTNCYINAPISSTEDKYPVIIFNHGYGSFAVQNTILCSDEGEFGIYSLFSRSSLRIFRGKIFGW